MRECPKCRHCYDDDVELCPTDKTKPVSTIDGTTTLSGRYILERRLGQGGMGIVFRAKHKFLKSYHAIKVILPSLVNNDENLLVRFNQEAVLAASIDHPNVIRVTDFGIEHDMPFLVMEYVDGLALSSYLKDGKPLAIKDAYGLFIPIAQAVAEAHRRGIVHRDLKPENVMVQKNLPIVKAVKVLDFGLAKIKSGDSYPSLVQAQTVNICGSPPYMSPEQWKGEGVDHRTDIYALSALLFQMLVGRLPFVADSMPSMMYQHLTDTPPTAASLGVNLPPPLEAAVLKGLQKNPDDRHSTMEDMLREMGDAIANPTTQSLSGEKTAIMPHSVPNTADVPTPVPTGTPLSNSQREKFLSYFDSNEKDGLNPDPKLAHEFLNAQDRIESAKTEAINADQLVRELAEAQQQAEAAQQKALQAKQQIEADVRRQVEAEMKRLAGEDKSKQEAEARRLSEEVEARRAAEERANYLAQAALEAQRLAESERKQRESEAQKRELHEGGRRDAEVEAQRLAAQVAEARKQYESARNEAAREAQFRADAEAKQKKVEGELQAVASSEAERRKLVEASAKKYIEEQAGRYEKEAHAAKQRLDEARVLIDQEAQKREQAEAARLQAEAEAQRLSQEIVEVHRQMQEMQQHITSDSGRLSQPPVRDFQGQVISLTSIGAGQTSRQIPSILLKTGEVSKKKAFIGLSVGLVALFVLLAGGIGVYLFVRRSSTVAKDTNANLTVTDKPVAPESKIKRVLIQGGSFKMGRDDVDPKNTIYGDEYPAHSVPIDSFRIDKYETTNAQYAEFVKEAHYKPPAYWGGENPPAGKEKLPVTFVTLSDAKAYAAWISKQEKTTCRLPTEPEWEYAARNGTQDSTYPWGNDWRPGVAILDGGAVAVGTSRDETLGGVADMLGNVTEWTSDVSLLYEGHPSKQNPGRAIAVRGLNFKAQKDKELAELFKRTELMLTYRNSVKEDQSFETLGFRLVCPP